MIILKISLIIIILVNNSLSNQDVKIDYNGDIYFITQSNNYISFVTINANQNYIYVLDKYGNLKFKKPYKDQPSKIIICELYKKILISYYNNEVYEEEAYINNLYNLDSGEEEEVLDLYTYLKLSFEGKYLYSSTHLHDNPSPIQVYNLESGEHFDIHARKWSKVINLRKNKLIILERLSGRNRKSTRRNWTQLGTNFKIYDLDKKSTITEKNLKDENNNPIILPRDDHNNYSLNVDANNNIFIFGSIKTGPKEKSRQYKFLKLDESGSLIWSLDVQRRGWPKRIENLNDIQIEMNQQFLNKNSGEFEIINNSELSNKKIIWSNEIAKLDTFKIGQIEFDHKNKTIRKGN